MKIEPSYKCYSKLDGDDFPKGVNIQYDTYCEMPVTTTMSAGSKSSSAVSIIMVVKLALTFKIDSGSWMVINAVQLVRSFILLHADMPFNLRNFLAVGIVNFNMNFDYGINILKKLLPKDSKIDIQYPGMISYLP